jgi:hypothetical protein
VPRFRSSPHRDIGINANCESGAALAFIDWLTSFDSEIRKESYIKRWRIAESGL